MYTLGINAAFHDSAAALVSNGDLIAAAEEERFTHVKHGKRPVPFAAWELPFHAIDYCLKEATIKLEQIDHIAYSFDPGLFNMLPQGGTGAAKFYADWDPLFHTYVNSAPEQLADGCPHHLQKRFAGCGDLRHKWHFVEHHVAHAASAFYPSPFKRAAVMTLDGRGENATTSYFTGNGNSLNKLSEVCMPLRQLPTDHEKNIAQLEQADFVTANCAISRSVLERTGGFDEDFTMAWREDSGMEFSLLLHNIPIRYVSEALVLHPARKAEWGISIRSEKKNMFNALLYKKYTEMYNRKIKSRPPLLYYGSLFSAAGMMAAPILPASVFMMFLVVFISITASLVSKRLQRTSKSPSHIIEMIVTSMLIPACAVFWNTYGCIRYKSLLI